MAAVEEEAERREASEERITDTRMEVGGLEDTDKVAEEEEEVEAMEDPAMAGAATPTGAARPELRVEAVETTEALMIGGEAREVMSAVSIFYLGGSSSTDTPPAWPKASEGQELVMCDFDRMFLP